MNIVRLLIFIGLSVLATSTSFAAGPPDGQAAPAQQTQAQDAKCEHGVKPAICTRCNPKLSGVFKAKGDWCAEHTRPESQCVICHPELADQGVK